MTKDKSVNIVLTGYDESGNYIGMQEQAARLAKIVMTDNNKEGTIPTTLPMYIKPENK